MTSQLPAVVVAGAKNVAGPLGAALDKSGKFPKVYRASSATELSALTPELPSNQKLVYLFSPTMDVDYPNIGLEQIVQQIAGNKHVVMAIGGTDQGEKFGQEQGLPIVRPGMNIPLEIAKASGVQIHRGQQPKPAGHSSSAPEERDSRRQSVSKQLAVNRTWREASEQVHHAPSRELAPREGGGEVWGGALDSARRRGDLQPGHHARGFFVVFAARKGGVGKTTLTVNSAAYLGRALRGTGRRVVLVDMNLQQADIGSYIHKDTPTVYDLVRNPSRLTSEHIESALVHNERDNFYALLGPGSINDANPARVHVDLYAQILELLRGRFDYILIDTPVAEPFHEIMRLTLPKANYIIAPVAPSSVTLENQSEWLNQITAPRHTNGYGIEPRRIGLVLNRAKVGIGLDPEDVEDTLSSWTFIGMFPDSDEWQLAENTGQLIGANPTKELEGPFRHMLYEATRDPALQQNSRPLASANEAVKKKNWLRRIFG